MKIKNIFDIAGRAMAAQMVRLNTISSNLANAGATTGDPETVYKPLKPEFKTQYSENVKKNGISTVNVSKVVELQKIFLTQLIFYLSRCKLIFCFINT